MKDEERLQVLKMIEQGLITAQEGARLLNALEESSAPPEKTTTSSSKPRWFRVRVTDIRSGKSKVNVNIPWGLVNVGIRMGARFAPEIEDMDLTQLLKEIEEQGRQGKIIDVEDEEDGERVEIFVE